MKKVVMFVVVVMLTAFVAAAQAEVKAGSFSVTPFVGGYIFEGNEIDKAYNNEDTYAVGLRAGYNFTKHFGVEGFFNYIPMDNKDWNDDNEVELFGYGIEGLYHFMPESRFVPFLAIGVGGIHYDALPNDPDNMDKLALDYGAGFKLFVTDNIALRADVRHVIPINERYNDLLYTFGINFAFGGEEKVVEAKVEEPLPPPPPPPPPPAPKPVIIEKGRQTLDVKFDFDKSTIKEGYYHDIDNLVDVMKDYSDLKVVIEGHTDSVGTDAYNKNLSQERAGAVKKYMVEKGGIDANRISAVGYGEERPIASNDTDEGRLQNRRVEAAVDYIIEK
jgi:OmpA-OmpF porin, OOP family